MKKIVKIGRIISAVLAIALGIFARGIVSPIEMKVIFFTLFLSMVGITVVLFLKFDTE